MLSRIVGLIDLLNDVDNPPDRLLTEDTYELTAPGPRGTRKELLRCNPENAELKLAIPSQIEVVAFNLTDKWAILTVDSLPCRLLYRTYEGGGEDTRLEIVAPGTSFVDPDTGDVYRATASYWRKTA